MRGRAFFWWCWLMVVSAGVVLAGLVFVLAPGLTRRLFSLLAFATPETIDAFGDPAVPYVSLVHAVLGAVMVGWGVALLLIVSGPLRRRSREAWWTVSLSLAAWLIPDTAYSLWSGFWQNAVLNAVVAVLFAVPLAATYRDCDRRPEPLAQ